LGFLLDTSVAIDLRDSRGQVKARLAALSSQPQISAITRVELEGGVYALADLVTKRRQAVDIMLQHIEVIDFNSEMASIYGRIVSRTAFNRRKIIDRMIAATALALDLTLITANGDDFTDIDGLKLEIWKP
jgi:tRNA(fMet)-specific endonuclease VapC